MSVGLIPENELSSEAGVELDPRSSGPIVYENDETSSPLYCLVIFLFMI